MRYINIELTDHHYSFLQFGEMVTSHQVLILYKVFRSMFQAISSWLKSDMGIITVNHHSKRGLISRFYGIIEDGSQIPSENMRVECISVEEWQKICIKAQTQSKNTHFKFK